ncbi:hypothetical protein OIU34_24550 [Pararhizobium sp. BT-229]|uniref:hypothetical protein n=1 Tax=Pararhizobium sp. BT-229 TaxID=2986923 RepID=UPI0021F7C745|nr:hypothetical protein [Pararhizobium sp. BT-229]MCV9965072.1 hypothetical protein [Pararhizobium sp. BT-229]
MTDVQSYEIEFDASASTAALVAASQATPSHRTERFTWFAAARSFAVQVTLDTLRPVLLELVDGPEGTFEGISGVRATVTNAGGRKKTVVFDDPRGQYSMAVGIGPTRTSAVFFGQNGISAEQAVEAVHRRHHNLPCIETLPAFGNEVIVGDTSPAAHDLAVHAASALAGYLKEIRPATMEAAITSAKTGCRKTYITPEADTPFLRATAAALAVDGHVAWGCVNTTLDVLWSDVLTAEFASRSGKADELARAILTADGPGYQEDEASWAEETPDGAALVLLARDEVGIRIETRGDTLSATLVDYESGSPVESIAVVDRVSSEAPKLRSNAAYSARLATNLGNFAFLYLDDHHETLCINAKRATSPSP